MAGAATRVLKLVVDGDVKGLQGASQRGEKALDGWRGSFAKWNRRAVTASLGVLTAFGGVAKDLKSLASEAEQSLGAVDSVFGEHGAQIKKWADEADTRLGLSAHSYREYATVTGALFKNMGVPMDEVAEKTDWLIELGADLAATFGGPTSDAVDALNALMRGESNPIERYGVSIKKADINARLAAKGLDDLEGEARKEAETMAMLELLTEQTADAQGQFSRETDTAAGKAQIAAAQWENIRTELGMRLLPIYTTLMGFISGTVLPILDEHQGKIAVIAGVIVGLAGFVLTANAAWKVYTATKLAVTAVTKGFTAAQKALNLVMRGNPFILVASLIIALGAALVGAYQKSETFRRVVQSAFNGVRTAAGWVIDRVKDVLSWFRKIASGVRSALSGVASAITAPFRSAFSGIRSAWNSTVGGKGFSIPGWVPGIGGKSFRIPRLHSGGVYRAPVGQFEGLALLRDGERVLTPEQSDGDIAVNVMISPEAIAGIAQVEIKKNNKTIKRQVLAGAGAY